MIMTQEVLSEGRARWWESVYARRRVDRVSWYQPSPEASLRLIDALGLPLDAATVDVGGGASTLVDHLLAEGRSNLAVLDISAAALQAARNRVGDLGRVMWIHEDVLTWRPTRRYALWHDRAAFHFLVESAERAAYLDTLDCALGPAGAVVIGTFATDGPQECSGLPVTRYDPGGLGSTLGSGFEVVETLREQHTTPAGSIQPFTWVAARRIPD